MVLGLREHLCMEAPCKHPHKGEAQLTSRARSWSPSFLESKRFRLWRVTEFPSGLCLSLSERSWSGPAGRTLCMSSSHLGSLRVSLSHPSYGPNGILYLFSPHVTKCLTHFLMCTLTCYCSLNAFVARMGPKGQWLIIDYGIRLPGVQSYFFSLITVWPSPSHLTSLGLNTYGKNVMKIKWVTMLKSPYKCQLS